MPDHGSTQEVELKFLVPAESRALVQAEMSRPSATLERRSLVAVYLDTPDRRLADAGMSWRLRREGRRWVQTLKATGRLSLSRFEHEVLRPGPEPDATLHAGTPAGQHLLALLAEARSAGVRVVPRFETQVRRLSRRFRSGRSQVEIAYDEGRIVAAGHRLRLAEVEFEHAAGPAEGIVAVARRWQRRFGLVLDPRTKSDRGDRLAEGRIHIGLRKAAVPGYDRDATAVEAFEVVFDECMAQVLRNAIGLVDGDPALRVEHVHQLRVGIRRLRSALSSFRPWIQPPPPALVDGVRHLFAELGKARDADVMDSGVAQALRAAGAPDIQPAAVAEPPDPAAVIRDGETQQMLLGWLEWRLVGQAGGRPQETADRAPAAAPTAQAEAPAAGPEAAAADTLADRPPADPLPFDRAAARRLRRWHRRIASAAAAFETLDETALHELRKRIKKQRYAVEFFSPALKGGQVRRYLKSLAAVQECMGELNDLVVARDHYQSMVDEDPAAWFALGWLAARIAAARREALPALKDLASCAPPGAR